MTTNEWKYRDRKPHVAIKKKREREGVKNPELKGRERKEGKRKGEDENTSYGFECALL